MSEEMNAFELPAELRALERRLAGFAPVAPPINRDKILYEAGRAAATRAARRQLNIWRAAAGCLLVTCAGLAMHAQYRGDAASPGRSLTATTNQKPMGPVPVPVDVVVSAPRGAIVASSPERLPHPNLLTLDARLSWAATAVRTGGGGGKSVPTLRPGDGLDALPAWQQRALAAGSRS